MKSISDVWKKLEQVELVQVHPEEMKALYVRCFEFEHPRIVEIGSAHGASSIVFAEAARQLKGIVYCIDNFVEGYEGQEKFGDYARKAFLRNTKSYPEIHLMDMSSSRAIHTLVDSLYIYPIDVLFVDGDHTYEGVKSDCENYLSRIRPGGYVGFHDYNNVAFSGVKKASDEYCQGWDSWSFWNLMIFQKPTI